MSCVTLCYPFFLFYLCLHEDTIAVRNSGWWRRTASRGKMTTQKTTRGLDSNPMKDGIDRYVGVIIAQKHVKNLAIINVLQKAWGGSVHLSSRRHQIVLWCLRLRTRRLENSNSICPCGPSKVNVWASKNESKSGDWLEWSSWWFNSRSKFTI